jgi:hypothetical protein
MVNSFPELLIRKSSPEGSRISYIAYDPLRHMLCVGMNHCKISYMGVPDSVFLHMSLIDNPEEFFFAEIYGKYPFLIEQEKQTPTANKRRKRFLERLRKSSSSPDSSD